MMAEALLKEMDPSLEVFSAGLHADYQVDPLVIRIMQEIGIDISIIKPNSYLDFEGIFVDYLITLCEGTKDKITSVNIPAKHKIHLGFEDPNKADVPEHQILNTYRDIRDEIRNELEYFYNRILAKELMNSK